MSERSTRSVVKSGGKGKRGPVAADPVVGAEVQDEAPVSRPIKVVDVPDSPDGVLDQGALSGGVPDPDSDGGSVGTCTVVCRDCGWSTWDAASLEPELRRKLANHDCPSPSPARVRATATILLQRALLHQLRATDGELSAEYRDKFMKSAFALEAKALALLNESDAVEA